MSSTLRAGYGGIPEDVGVVGVVALFLADTHEVIFVTCLQRIKPDKHSCDFGTGAIGVSEDGGIEIEYPVPFGADPTGRGEVSSVVPFGKKFGIQFIG